MIRVLIERRIKPGKEMEAARLLLELRSQGMKQPGYISGETLYFLDDPSLWMVISTWTDIDSWTAWHTVSERDQLNSKMASVTSEEEKVRIYGNVSDLVASTIREVLLE
jgi:antibiotic biosynthesis monooxygenase (ABM) superfamily enzyme